MDFDPMKPIWVQVANRLKQQIVTGALPPEASFPAEGIWRCSTGSIPTRRPGSTRSLNARGSARPGAAWAPISRRTRKKSVP